MTFIQTFSGKAFDLFDPKVEDVCLEDIAGPLSRQCRWNGQCRCFYSVAQHSMHVADLLKRAGAPARLQLIGLLHDAREAYTGDIVNPLMKMLFVQTPWYSYGKREQDFADHVLDLEAEIREAIFAALIPGMPDGCETTEEASAWNWADTVSRLTEVRDLFTDPPVRDWTKGIYVQPDQFPLNAPIQPQFAEELFCKAYTTLRDRVEAEMMESVPDGR